MSKNRRPQDSFVQSHHCIMALPSQSVSRVQKEKSGLILVETEQGQKSVEKTVHCLRSQLQCPCDHRLFHRPLWPGFRWQASVEACWPRITSCSVVLTWNTGAGEIPFYSPKETSTSVQCAWVRVTSPNYSCMLKPARVPLKEAKVLVCFWVVWLAQHQKAFLQYSMVNLDFCLNFIPLVNTY